MEVQFEIGFSPEKKIMFPLIFNFYVIMILIQDMHQKLNQFLITFFSVKIPVHIKTKSKGTNVAFYRCIYMSH